MVFKSGVQSIGNCLIRLDPKSCNQTFFSKNLDSVQIHCRPYFQRKSNDSPRIFSADMVQTNAHNSLKFETCNIESTEQVHAKDRATGWPRKIFESMSRRWRRPWPRQLHRSDKYHLSLNRRSLRFLPTSKSWWPWKVIHRAHVLFVLSHVWFCESWLYTRVWLLI